MKKLILVLLTLALSHGLLCAQERLNSQQATRDQVNEFLELMHTRRTMKQLLDGMKAAQIKGAQETFKNLVPNPTPEQLERLQLITDDVFQDLSIDEMVDAIVPIYQRHFTGADLDAFLGFYKSPPGQKFLQEQPAMVSESMQAGQDIMMKKLPQILDRLKTRIAQLAEESKQGKAGDTSRQN